MRRALLICDADFAVRERALLDRLAIGLLDAGLRIVMALPASVCDSAEDFVERVPYAPPTLARPARHAARQLWRTLADRGLDTDRAPLSLIHVFGSSAWSVAARLGAMVGAPVVVEAWTADLARRAARDAAGLGHAGDPVVSVPGAGLIEPCSGCAIRPTVCAWGARAPDRPPTRPPGAQPTAVLVVNPARQARARVALRALAGVARDEDALILADAGAFDASAGLWRFARSIGLESRLSLIPDLESRRSPALDADALIVVLEPGEHRSVLLDAMASESVVIAAADPLCDWLRPDQTGLIVDDAGDESAWGGAFAAALSRSAPAGETARRARRWVIEHRRASRHIADTLALYERIAGLKIRSHRPAAG